ncbi:MAG: hypothetical protein QNK11_09495 [Legionella sp.]|nr:hypothetical protein [Legionella sp.]
MKKLYLHIGSHKTGSSSIQLALYHNQTLLNEHDFSFFSQNPDGADVEIGNTSNWLTGNKAFQDDLYQGVGLRVLNANELADQLNSMPCNHIIMSAENFSWIFEKDEIKKLYQALSLYFDVKILVYIRRQDKLAISHYQQVSKESTHVDFGYYKGGCKALPSGRKNYDEYLDFNEKLSKWSDVFGQENMLIRIFERELLVGHDVVTDFLQSIGLRNLKIKPVKVNESNGFEKTKVGHLVNYSGLTGSIESRIREGANNLGKSLPNRKDAEAFYARYLESNIKLNNKFTLSETHQDIFNHDFFDYSETSTDLWTEDSANQAIQNILSALTPLNALNAEVLRISALIIRFFDLKLSFKLMSMAKILAPDDIFIAKKVELYQRKLSQKNNTNLARFVFWCKRLLFFFLRKIA